jgi:hypothetical protein
MLDASASFTFASFNAATTAFVISSDIAFSL